MKTETIIIIALLAYILMQKNTSGNGGQNVLPMGQDRGNISGYRNKVREC